MSNYTVSIFFLLFWIWSSTAEQSTLDCKPLCKQDIVVSISNRQNETGRSSTQVNLEDGSEKFEAKQYNIQVNIDHDSKCDSEKPEPPRPFYELIPGMSYYKLHTNFKNWHSAKLVCEKEGTHLAIMNSHEEVGILQEFWRRQPRRNNAFIDDIIYLGFDDIGTEGVWKTLFNKPLSETGYVEWEPGQPVNATNEDCGCIYAKSGKLHDCICSDILPFFCEKEL